ncbi:aldehyde dehydrogenase family protein [Tropicimonas sp. TH_r6]|uniref:aldehyde dehydrogenase family protein n=1 Tax=Tropicimonas sp. TH_r6 TaxID=3082085 RepID=UPI0029540D04|nr:aldehyde dehydrogenase family protein [Tropicimonas sp. TH_r6]MDV7145045.1 aldehyde dehydrogenase family protein [Tropicimonas sp. TH_r6]
MTELKDYWQNYIDGEWVDGGAGRIEVIDPASGKVLATHALADARDVDFAVQAARQVHRSGELSGLRPVDRGRMVQAMGRFLLEKIDEIAPVLSLEQGKPLWEARVEITGAARYFEYYGNQAETLEGRSIPLGRNYFDFTTYEPYGVSAQIIPWNYPLEMAARSLSAALATGNACVIKSPELTPLSQAWFALAAEAAGLPSGAVNILCGYGREAGAALAGHPQVNQVVFTGSVPTGVAVAKAAALNVVPCVLELGGKSAAILHDDADLDAFVNDVRWGIYFNAGQTCSAMSRVIVHESRHDDLVDRVAEMAETLSVGPGIDRAEFGANMGAMVSLQQRDRAEIMVTEAINAGANLATGGRRPKDYSGAFLQPTVLTDVTPDMAIAREEIFGPVLSVIPFRDDEEAIEIANSTQYGLVGGVFTSDLDRAMRAARRIRAGQVFVNEWYAGGVETPFGGYGKSGYGREKGREALLNYVQTKNVAIRLR